MLKIKTKLSLKIKRTEKSLPVPGAPEEAPPTIRKEDLQPTAVTHSSAISPARGKNSKAIHTLRHHCGVLGVRHYMDLAVPKLKASRILIYHGDLTKELVAKYPRLEKFVCWSSEIRSGISWSKAGKSRTHADAGVYLKVSMGKDITFQAHKLMMTSKMGIDYDQVEENYDTSHLCHNRRCWRPSHMACEKHSANVLRGSGAGCGGHVVDAEAGRVSKLCQHDPPCVFVRVLRETEPL